MLSEVTLLRSTAPGVTYAGSRSIAGNAFPPTDALALPNSYFGPNFQFTTSTSVPDASSTWMLLLLGVEATFGLNLLLHSGLGRNAIRHSQIREL